MSALNLCFVIQLFEIKYFLLHEIELLPGHFLRAGAHTHTRARAFASKSKKGPS